MVANVLPWRDAPDSAFREWLRQTFRHARSPMFRMPDEWGALVRFAAARRRHVTELTTEDLRSFLAQLEARRAGSRKSAVRCRRLLELLAMVFEDIRRDGYCAANPAHALLQEYPAVARPLPIVLTDAQRVALERLLYGQSGSWQTVRNRALAVLVLADRMRPAEIAQLKLHHLETVLDEPMCGLTSPARRALRAWLERRTAVGVPGQYVFPADETGAPYTPVALYRLVRGMLKRAGIDIRALSRLDIRDCLASGNRWAKHRSVAPAQPSAFTRSRPTATPVAASY